MNSVEKIASNADGKPVQSTTSTKISQTWLASQTGPIAQSISSRGRRPRSPPPASRLQRPAPKSAPPKTAYIVAPIHEDDGDGVRAAHREPLRGDSRGRRPCPGRTARRRRPAVLAPPAPRHRPQRDDQRRAERGVERHDRGERDPDAACVRDRVRRAHDVVDDPRLAPDLGHDPAALQRDHRGHAGDARPRGGTSATAGSPLAPPADAEPERRDRSAACRSRPSCRRHQCSIVLAGGRSSGGTESSPVTCVLVLQPTRNESKPGIPIPPLTPLDVQLPKMYSVTSVEVCLDALHRRELDRLVLGDRARGRVADRELDRRGDARDRQRDQQPEPMDAVTPAAQHPDGVDRGDEEPGDQVRREDHVRNLVGHRRVEDHLQRLDRRDRCRSSGEKPCGWFIHEFTATTENAPPRPAITTGTPVQKCVHGDRRFQPKM